MMRSSLAAFLVAIAVTVTSPVDERLHRLEQRITRVSESAVHQESRTCLKECVDDDGTNCCSRCRGPDAVYKPGEGDDHISESGRECLAGCIAKNGEGCCGKCQN